MASTSPPSTRRVLPPPPPPSRCMQGLPGAAEAAGPAPGGLIRSAIVAQPAANGTNAWAEAVPPTRHSPRRHHAPVSLWRGRR
jgi:hypothetical protein